MNNILKKTPMPQLEPQERNKTFDEVATGYTEEMAKCEADRCLNCKNKPCVSGCPVNVRIPEFISNIKNGDYATAYEVITSTNSLPSICGRVCTQESQCESKCVRGVKGEPVGIGRLERFVADYNAANMQNKNANIEKNHIKVAIIGSGPSGLTCTGDLIKNGYDVTIFEAMHTAGGVLAYGIPEFRLPKGLVEREIDNLKDAGVEIQTNMVIGKILDIQDLFDMGYKAVYLGTGAGLPSFMDIEGESLNGVFCANEFLTRLSLMKAYKFPEYDTPVTRGKNVAVVGGGNVAMDAARSAKRLGAENVYIVYRRSEEELPARKEEIEHAKEEGITFKLLTSPVKMLGDENGWVNKMECISMELGEPDSSGRRRPVEIPNSNYFVNVDTAIMAIGTTPNHIITNSIKELELNKKGGIAVDEYGMTSIPGVFAGGDAVTGAATVILAMGAGKKAAEGIDKWIKENK